MKAAPEHGHGRQAATRAAALLAVSGIANFLACLVFPVHRE